jgi:NADH-quinone oxidoreductase subunit J
MTLTFYTVCFYLLALVIIAATVLAITRRHPVHAVVYLVLSFLGSALLYYLLGAPFLAALEIIIYAGAIMVLFLFVIMMLKSEVVLEDQFEWKKWMPAIVLSLIYLVLALLLVSHDPRSRIPLQPALASPRELGRFVFERYWISVEMISLLLLISLVAVIQLGRGKGKNQNKESL